MCLVLFELPCSKTARDLHWTALFIAQQFEMNAYIRLETRVFLINIDIIDNTEVRPTSDDVLEMAKTKYYLGLDWIGFGIYGTLITS
jgi:hypothetical protein